MKILFNNCSIYTLDEENNIYNSMLVENGKIVEIGKDIKLPLDCTEINLENSYIYPGLNDSHMHLVNHGYTNANVRLFNCQSPQHMGELIVDFIEKNNISPTQWVRGRGWNEEYFTNSKNLPTRYDLDRYTDNPLVMTRACGHIAVVNSKVLELLKINENIPYIDGGQIDCDENGAPTGIFRENALELIYSKIPAPSLETVKNIIESTTKEMNSFGITSCHSDDFCNLPTNPYNLVIKAYEELIAENKLTVRVCEQAQFKTLEDYEAFISQKYCPYKEDLFKVGSLKLLLDGALGTKTAALRKPYLGEEENFGILTMSKETLKQWSLAAKKNKMPLAIHCIGDGAISMALDAFKELKDLKARHGIVHCQITDIPLLKRMAELEVLAYVQPIFLDYDRHIVRDRVGAQLESTSYNWKTMIDLGIHTSFGTDAPVEPFNTFHNMYEAITRKDLKGQPENGFLIDQALDMEETLRAYTIEGAYASFEENIKGTLEKGKFADFITMEQDLYKINPMEIKNMKVKSTYLGGKCVYKS